MFIHVFRKVQKIILSLEILDNLKNLPSEMMKNARKLATPIFLFLVSTQGSN